MTKPGSSSPSSSQMIAVASTVPPDLDGSRLDRALAAMAEGVSRSRAKEAIASGAVSIDGEAVVNPRRAVIAGEAIAALVEMQPSDAAPCPSRIELDIVAEEDEYLVVDKRAGMVVHPARGHWRDTLANAVAAHSPQAGRLARAGVVHRLDKDTSGLLVVAKSERARLALVEQFKKRSVGRVYLAIVHGSPPATGAIELPIGRDRANRKKKSVASDGRFALTRFVAVAQAPGYALLRCMLESGRTHQIRVHLEHAGYPVAGDRVYRRYGAAEGGMFPRQMLHAKKLAFADPATGERKEYKSALPPDFRAGLAAAGLQHV